MIEQLWETNVFHLNLPHSASLIGLDESEQFTRALPLVKPVVQHYMLKGYASDADIEVYSPYVLGTQPTFSAVWFIRGGIHFALRDPRSRLEGADQFSWRTWTRAVKDGDILIFPSYVEYDYEVIPDNEVQFFDIVVGGGTTKF